ncbi:MAG: tryptophan 7-halogenase [Pseudomonadota bacterium]
MKLDPGRPLRSVVIAGSGLEAWLAAAVLALRLDGRRVDITVCPVSGSQDWDGLYTALPAWPGDLFRDLGYSDLKLATLADASFSLGTRVSGPGLEAVIKPHGPVGINVGGVAFHHYWRRVSTRLTPDDYFRYSPGTEALRRSALAPPVPANALGPLQHEMVRHVDPWALQKHLRHQAYAMDVREARGPLAEVQRADDGRIAGLTTTRGEKLSADLFVDCTGPNRRLCSEASAWEAAPLSRAAWLWAEHEHRDAAPLPWSSLSGTEAGWKAVFPRGTEEVTLHLAGDRTTGEASGTPAGEAPGNPRGNAVPYHIGHTPTPWEGNCVALGSAAASVLPLDGLPARLLMNMVQRLVALLPGRDCHPAETLEFNQLSAEDAREANHLGTLYEAWRQGHAPREAAIDGTLPEPLALRVRLFARRGWLSPRDSQLVPEDCWRAAFILLGVIPDHHDRLADRIERDQVEENLLALKHKVRQIARTFPAHDEYFAAMQATIREARP